MAVVSLTGPDAQLYLWLRDKPVTVDLDSAQVEELAVLYALLDNVCFPPWDIVPPNPDIEIKCREAVRAFNPGLLGALKGDLRLIRAYIGHLVDLVASKATPSDRPKHPRIVGIDGRGCTVEMPG